MLVENVIVRLFGSDADFMLSEIIEADDDLCIRIMSFWICLVNKQYIVIFRQLVYSMPLFDEEDTADTA